MGMGMMPVCLWLECFMTFFMGLLLSICMAVCCLNDADA
jgi:hypothetical protein